MATNLTLKFICKGWTSGCQNFKKLWLLNYKILTKTECGTWTECVGSLFEVYESYALCHPFMSSSLCFSVYLYEFTCFCIFAYHFYMIYQNKEKISNLTLWRLVCRDVCQKTQNKLFWYGFEENLHTNTNLIPIKLFVL